MALVYIDGFDTYQTGDILKRWTESNGSPAITSGGRTSQLLELSSGEYVYLGVSSQTTYIVGFAFKVSTLPTTISNFLAFSNTADQCYLALTSTGALEARRSTVASHSAGGTSSTSLATTAGGVIAENTWYYIECRCLLSDTVGEFDARVNGVTVLETADLSIRDTSYNSTAIVSIGLGYNANTAYIDDLYICDTSGSVNNTFLGDVTVEALFPQTDAVAAGTHEDFTCSTGADQGAMVDESSSDFPDEDTTYITSSTDTHRSTFNYPDLSVASADIFGVQVNICAKKSDTGTRTYTSAIRSGGSDYDGETELSKTVAPSDSAYATGVFLHEVNPDTSTAWTVSGVNGAEFGVLITS